MIENIKLYENEVVKDSDLPETYSWEQLIDAPQSVKDLNYDDGLKLDAINADGDFLNDIINPRLNTQTARILAEFQFQSSGALAMKTDSSNGLWLSPTGILGKKAGVTTFAIDTGGNATFRGSIAASDIDGSTITGGTVRTASSGARAQLNSTTNALEIYDADRKRIELDNDELVFFNTSGVSTAHIRASTYSLEIDTTDGAWAGWIFDSSYGVYFMADATAVMVISDYGISMNNSRDINMNGGEIIGIDEIVFNKTTRTPNEDGEILHYDNGSTQSMRVQMDGTDYTFNLSFL